MMHGSLAERLRVLRARQGLSLTEASKRAGITRDTLSDLERGKRHAYMPTLAKIAEGYGVPVDELLEEPALTGKVDAPDTGLTALSPAELETRVFGAPVREGEEPKPIIDARKADAMARQIRRERDELERWLEQYADAPSPTRFAARAEAEEVQVRTIMAQVYLVLLIDVWSKLADPRDVPFKGALPLAGEAEGTLFALIERARERVRSERAEDRAG
jgi:transcriptional regulator with XRE-family HTH domain